MCGERQREERGIVRLHGMQLIRLWTRSDRRNTNILPAGLALQPMNVINAYYPLCPWHSKWVDGRHDLDVSPHASLSRRVYNIACEGDIYSTISGMLEKDDYANYIVHQKVHPFYFCDYSVKCWPIFLPESDHYVTFGFLLSQIHLSSVTFVHSAEPV